MYKEGDRHKRETDSSAPHPTAALLERTRTRSNGLSAAASVCPCPAGILLFLALLLAHISLLIFLYSSFVAHLACSLLLSLSSARHLSLTCCTPCRCCFTRLPVLISLYALLTCLMSYYSLLSPHGRQVKQHQSSKALTCFMSYCSLLSPHGVLYLTDPAPAA